VQLFARAFAFLFLAVTYYFSKSAEEPKLLWNMTLGLLAAILTILILFAIISPQLLWPNYRLAQMCVRVFGLICFSYISIRALKSHIEQPEPTTLMIPLGYVLLGIGQYSLLAWAVDQSIFAFFGALALRLAGLAVFLFVSFRTFYGSEQRGNR
jgi:phosphoglycerol transferase MdoB-like AlkP superfamily enzyme